jgi:hypothetical protein
MSGTAALAAARKRRANPQPNQPNQLNQPNQPNQPNPATKTNGINTINDSISEEFPKATNPAMLLLQHNMLIQRLQKEVAQLKENKPKGPETDYKSEYLGLLEEMKEMKKVLLKVQSFSMETNLEVMKLKRNVNEIPSEKMDLSSITVNDIDMTTINEALSSV